MNCDVDPIECKLRTPEPPLADGDFTAAVLARLPRRRRRATARRWTLAGAAALGGASTLAVAPPLGSAVASFSPWNVPPLAVSIATAVAIVAIPALLVFYSERSGR